MRPAAARAAARPQADQRYRPTARPRSSPLALAPAHTLPPRARRPRTHWPQAQRLQGIPPRSRRQFSPGAISTSNHLSSNISALSEPKTTQVGTWGGRADSVVVAFYRFFWVERHV